MSFCGPANSAARRTSRYVKKLHEKEEKIKMPHIIIKLYPGRSEKQKADLAEKIVEHVVSIARCEEIDVSVAFEEVEPAEWFEKVYKPDIQNKQNQLIKMPGYGPLIEK